MDKIPSGFFEKTPSGKFSAILDKNDGFSDKKNIMIFGTPHGQTVQKFKFLRNLKFSARFAHISWLSFFPFN